MKVSFFQDKVGKFVNTHPQFMIKRGDRESTRLNDKINNITINDPIYVTGLARSGTTILLEKLTEHPELVSLRYKDFPLVHVPHWWENFLNRAGSNGGDKVERAHKDRIKITPDSPEALEEILWMSFYNSIHDPSVNNILDENNLEDDFIKFYQNTIKKILLSRNGKRYIAKGNYNISRIKLLNAIFPDAKFVIAVRNPIDTIASLIKQHNLFCEIEKSDKKVLRYMQNLGHFEFGLDRRPLNFGNTELTSEIQSLLNNEVNILGFAKYWSVIYSYVIELMEDAAIKKNIIIIDFDKFCNNPIDTLQNLYDHCSLRFDNSIVIGQAKTISAPSYYTHGFSEEDIEIIKSETDAVFKQIKTINK